MVAGKSVEKKAKAPKAAAPKKAAPAAGSVDAKSDVQHRRVLVGTVVSNKMQKTIVIKVDRKVRHPLYKKYITRTHKFKAHDEKNDAKIGDIVLVVESRPLSRDKRWALQSIVRRANQVADVNV